MNQADKKNFIEGLNACLEMYGRPKASDMTARMWWAALERFSLEDVTHGFNRHCQDPDQGQFAPKPADIIRNIAGNTQTQAQLAWTKVDKAIRTVGPYQSVVFDDQIIHAVIQDMGGWTKLAMTDGKDYPFAQNEFEKRYRAYATNPPKTVPRKLVGFTEADYNLNRGSYQRGTMELPKPVPIGDLDRARLVYQGGTDTGSGGKSVQELMERLLA